MTQRERSNRPAAPSLQRGTLRVPEMPGIDPRVRNAINKPILLEPPLYWTREGKIGIRLGGATNVDAHGYLIVEVGAGIEVSAGSPYGLTADLESLAEGLTSSNKGPQGGGGSGSLVLSDALPIAVDPAVPAGAGSDLKASRASHSHPVVFATTDPSEVLLAGAASPGGATLEIAPIDHVHSASKGVPVAIGFENVAGNSNLFADAEHRHADNPMSLAFERDRHVIQAYKRRGEWIAGVVASPTDVLNHNGDDLYPFMVATCIDVDGYPHNRHKRLEGSGVGNDSGIKGYEDGVFIGRGVLTSGRAVGWSCRGTSANSLGPTAFYEFVIEPNPTTTVFTGTHRMRMLTGELGLTWTGEYAFTFDATFKALAADAYAFEGRLAIAKPSGVLCFKKTMGGTVTGGFDFLNDDAVLQLRWRADEITNLDIYDETYQGLGASVTIRDYEVLELVA